MTQRNLTQQHYLQLILNVELNVQVSIKHYMETDIIGNRCIVICLLRFTAMQDLTDPTDMHGVMTRHFLTIRSNLIILFNCDCRIEIDFSWTAQLLKLFSEHLQAYIFYSSTSARILLDNIFRRYNFRSQINAIFTVYFGNAIDCINVYRTTKKL